MKPEDVPDEWIELAVRANADRNHTDLCSCVAWPERCVSGYTPTQWEHGDEAHTIAAVLPAHERQVRERVAAELRAAAQAIIDSNGEDDDPLTDEVWSRCTQSQDAPATLEDPRTIAIVAYEWFAARLTATCTTPCDAECVELCHEVHEVDWKRVHSPQDCQSARIARGES